MFLAFDDFMSPKVILISLLSAFITAVIIFFLLSFILNYSGEITKFIPTVFNDLVKYISEKLESYPITSFLLEHKLIMYLFRYLLYFGVGVVLYYLFFAIYSFVISFFNIFIIRYIQKKHYIDFQLKEMGIFRTITFYIKTVIITLILFLILLPIYLIPVLNILIFLPIYYFFHKSLVFDVSSTINNYKEYKKIKSANWGELKTKTLFCFLLTFIPILGILLYPYYVIYIGHYIIQETIEYRYINEFHKN